MKNELIRIFYENVNFEQLEYFVRILLACLCGALIGLEGSSRQKEAGLRTHIILAMGSAITMIVSKYGFFDLLSTYGIEADPSRLASNIITGISFLGAGVIFVRTGAIKGLTTAAGIWTTAAIGITLGAGMYFIGLSCTLLLLFFQILLHRFLPASERYTTSELAMTAKNTPETIEKIQKELTDKKIKIVAMKMSYADEGNIKLKFTVKAEKGSGMNDVMSIVKDFPEIISISGEF